MKTKMRAPDVEFAREVSFSRVSMSKIPDSKYLSKLGRRRKQIAFLVVGAATFFCLSLIWPLSTKSWRSESEVSLTLTKRKHSSDEFKKLLSEVVERNTSVDSISRLIVGNGMGIKGSEVSTADMAKKIQQRIQVSLFDQNFDPDDVSVRVGLNGFGSEREKFFVNVLATTIAKDFMTSPLAGILPTDSLPIEDVESLQQRHREIQQRANELLAQIQSNLKDSASEFVGSSPDVSTLVQNDDVLIDQLKTQLGSLNEQRSRIDASGGDSILELSAIDRQIDDVQFALDNATNAGQSSSPFQMASHTLNRVTTSNSLKASFDSLQQTIQQLANVTAEACTAAENASRTTPAFTISHVKGRASVPVGAVPSRRELLFLVLASCVFATIVSIAYKPFAQRGFESVEQIGKKLSLPVVATLESRNEFEDVTGPGIHAETVKPDTPGSNQVVNICKWILFCSLMLTIGFCLVNADIREAFMVSPFHGFAEIVWTVQGN